MKKSWTLLTLLLLIPFMTVRANAGTACPIPGASGSGTKEDPVVVDTFDELKDALQYQDSLYIEVNEFQTDTEGAYGPYYALKPGRDYLDGEAAIYQEGTKVLILNTTVRIAADQESRVLSSVIDVGGDLTIRGTGTFSGGTNDRESDLGAVIHVSLYHTLYLRGASILAEPIVPSAVSAVRADGSVKVHSGVLRGHGDAERYESSGHCAYGIRSEETCSFIAKGGEFLVENAQEEDYGAGLLSRWQATLMGGRYQGISSPQHQLQLLMETLYGLYNEETGVGIKSSSYYTHETCIAARESPVVSKMRLRINPPVPGERLTFDVIPDTHRVQLTRMEWEKEDGTIYQEEDKDAVYTQGRWTLTAHFQAVSYNHFPENLVPVLNGVPVTVVSLEPKEMVIRMSYDFPKLETVNFNLQLPVAGEVPGKALSTTEHVKISTSWLKADGKALKSSETFKAGEEYVLKVRAAAPAEQFFTEETFCTMNSGLPLETTEVSEDGKILTAECKLKAEAPDASIISVIDFSVELPRSNQPGKITSNTPQVTIRDDRTVWSIEGTGVVLNEDVYLYRDEDLKVRFTFTLNQSSLSFAEAPCITVNGEQGAVSLGFLPESDRYMSAEVTFRRVYNPFTDVSAKAFYYDAVLWAFHTNPVTTTGTDDTHFAPSRNCTRGDVVTFLWRGIGQPWTILRTSPFKDVKNTSKFYYSPVLWAVEEEVTTGTDETHFTPDRTCTRAEVLTFLWRTMGCPEPESSENPFADVKPGKYYYKAVLWAFERGITTGTDATHFSPSETCTRAQVVTFLYRTLR